MLSDVERWVGMETRAGGVGVVGGGASSGGEEESRRGESPQAIGAAGEIGAAAVAARTESARVIIASYDRRLRPRASTKAGVVAAGQRGSGKGDMVR